MLSRILVGVDGSMYADKALEYATSLALKFEEFSFADCQYI